MRNAQRKLWLPLHNFLPTLITDVKSRLAFTRPRCPAAYLELASVDFATVEAQPVCGGEETFTTISSNITHNQFGLGMKQMTAACSPNGLCLLENHLHARPTTYGERKSALSRLCLDLYASPVLLFLARIQLPSKDGTNKTNDR